MSGLTRRTQLLLDDERYRRLERRAKDRGTSVATIIREAIDAELADDAALSRRAAGRRLLNGPELRGTEPDWEDVKHDASHRRFDRLYGDQDA